jgi:single-strand DNA-binding protein
MAGVNKVILIGNLGSDPEVRHLSSGSVVANFNIATSESYTNKNGEKVTQTEWHRIELWDSQAQIAEKYLKKGMSVYIEGKLRTETWQDKDGVSRTTTRVRGTNLSLIGGRPDGATVPQGPSGNEPMAERAQSEPVKLPPSQGGASESDDLPF